MASKRMRIIPLTDADGSISLGDYAHLTPGERMELGFELSMTAWAILEPRVAEKRIQRSVVRVVRGEG